MAAIQDLLKQVSDPVLRGRLSDEISKLSKNKKFGLVFEDHVPECTPLYGVPLKCGSSVAKKCGKMDFIYTVKKIVGDIAECMNRITLLTENIPLNELVTVAQFGEPIFPSLEPIDKVINAPDDSLWHTLIEADNYHALQLLEYLYEGKVDCIYIDPPYNTGAKDWKYNNDYVDLRDSYRHSKWLSMMKKRLQIARRILAKDGVLIVTIDDNEFAHLWELINEIFPERKNFCVTIQHNPRGTQGDNFAVTHEFAIYSLSKSSQIYRREHLGDDISNFRKWGNQSDRSLTERANTFYPIIVDKEMNIVGFGEVCSLDFHPQSANVRHDDYIYVYPVDSTGAEKKWRYSRENENEIIPFLVAQKNNDIINIKLGRETENTKTVWTDTIYNSEEYGTKLIKKFIQSEFPFPKSVYAVRDCLWYAVSEKPEALILDFFAGSGTTLNAVNLLNTEDNGHRRCLLVTNNEVSDKEASWLNSHGFYPGSTEWESRGICRSVTWPRTKNSVRGKYSEESLIDGEYFTNLTVTKEINRSFYNISFISEPSEMKTDRKKQLVTLITGVGTSIRKNVLRLPDPPKKIKNIVSKSILPLSLVKSDSKFIVSEKHTISILFDPKAVDEWLVALEEQEHITDFYIVTNETNTFNEIKAKVTELLGTLSVTEPLKRPMSEGFPTNVEYFKLGFLDKNSVSLGQQFVEILPLLWLKAGAVGERPEVSDDDLPPWLILPQNNFAILLDEDRYGEFSSLLHDERDIGTIFFVTNSEEAFREMSDGVGIDRTYQLYRDYIDNFVIGARRMNQ
jgi:adenine-specific DNA-methyltransferase